MTLSWFAHHRQPGPELPVTPVLHLRHTTPNVPEHSIAMTCHLLSSVLSFKSSWQCLALAPSSSSGHLLPSLLSLHTEAYSATFSWSLSGWARVSSYCNTPLSKGFSY